MKIALNNYWWHHLNVIKGDVMNWHSSNQSISGSLVRRWEEAGRPHWTMEETIEELKIVNAETEYDGMGKKRERALSSYILTNNEQRIRYWIRVYHFCWINPDPSPCPVCGFSGLAWE